MVAMANASAAGNAVASPEALREHYDVVIAGGGMVGVSMALAALDGFNASADNLRELARYIVARGN